MKHYVIMAAGDFPVHPIPLKALNEADVLVACDSAAAGLVKRNLSFDYVVGDMDSLGKEYQEQLKDKLVHIREQDTNDLQKAFRFTTSLCAPGDRITILGAAGKREDHTIANISLLTDFAKVHPGIRILTDTGIFFPVENGFAIWAAEPGSPRWYWLRHFRKRNLSLWIPPIRKSHTSGMPHRKPV